MNTLRIYRLINRCYCIWLYYTDWCCFEWTGHTIKWVKTRGLNEKLSIHIYKNQQSYDTWHDPPLVLCTHNNWGISTFMLDELFINRSIYYSIKLPVRHVQKRVWMMDVRGIKHLKFMIQQTQLTMQKTNPMYGMNSNHV